MTPTLTRPRIRNKPTCLRQRVTPGKQHCRYGVTAFASLGFFAASAGLVPQTPTVFDVGGATSFVATSSTADFDGHGGGGGAGARRSSVVGGGGASGSRSRSHLTTLVVGRTYNVIVGTGGAGGVNAAHVAGGLGVASQVIDSVTLAVVWQAGGGRGGFSTSPVTGGAAGSTGDSIGDTIDVGLAGNTSGLGGSAPGGGAGAAAANPAVAGAVPGGGGGSLSAGTGGNGGAGGAGRVIVTQYA